MADQMRPTPRSPILGLFSDLVNLPLQYMSAPERTQQMQGTAQFLYDTGIPKTLERASYGDSLFSGAGGLGGTTRMHPETANALMNVAPALPAAGRLAARAVRATEGLPVGMSIKDVGKGIASNTSQFTGFKNTTPYGKAKEVAAYLDKLNIPYTINKSKTTNSAYLEIQTGKGDFDYPMQFRFSDHSTDLPHQNRQIFTNPKPDPNFDLDMFKDGGHDTDFAISKINDLVAKVKPKTVSQQATYPQQAALDLAQQRAALPIEQGGLGLPANNTAADRAKAMGFDLETYHGTNTPDMTSIDVNRSRPDVQYMQGFFTSDDPNLAGNYGDIVMPFLQQKGTTILDRRAARQAGLEVPAMDTIYDREKNILVTNNPANIRSRFAAFDPFRKDVATATAMGVALPDLLAQPVQQYPTPYETTPMYTDPFGNTIGSSIR